MYTYCRSSSRARLPVLPLLLVVLLCVTASAATKPPVPATGTYLGAILLNGQTTIYQFNRDMGVQHAIFMEFLEFPDVLNATNSDHIKIVNFISSCVSAGAMPALTLQVSAGLGSYTTQNIRDFATFLNSFNVPIFLRWCHEMNGSWYAWGQQPTLYVAKFREFADIIHSNAPGVAMVWTPNQGWGYSWPWGAYAISTNSPDFSLLDTDHNGVLSEQDDMYGPYYPGDNYVDWVGFSFYHWGNESTNGYNEVPWTGKWGQINGVGNPIPNFHDLFAAGHNKPMIIAETSALYDPNNTKGGGASEPNIKNTWIQQVYNLTDTNQPRLNVAFPQVKAICWFSQLKYESEVNGNVDWRLNDNTNVINFYRQTVSNNSYFVKALYAADNVTLGSAPATVEPNQTYPITVQYSARTNRDVILSLLDPAHNYAWYGGQTLSVTQGQGSLAFNLGVTNYPQSGTTYVWDVIIVPHGGNYSNTLDHVQMPVSVTADQLSFTSVPQPLRPQDSATIAFSFVTYPANVSKYLSVSLLDPTHNYAWYGSSTSAVPNGAGTISVPFMIQGTNKVTNGSFYVLSAYIARSTDDFTKATATAQTNVTVVADNLKFSSAPLSVQNNQAYTLKFAYSTDRTRNLTVNLLRPSTGYTWYGGSNAVVQPGTGSVSVSVRVVNSPPTAQDYQWSAFLSTQPNDFSNATATDIVSPVSVLKDGLNIVSMPAYLQPNQTYPLTVNYCQSLTTSKYVHVDLLDPVHNYAWYGGVSSNLPATQTNGCVILSLNVQNNPPAGTNYEYSAFIAPVGKDWTAETASDTKNATVACDNLQVVAAPAVILPNSTISVTLNYNVYPLCTGKYLAVNLLYPPQNYAWFGGTNVPIPAGTGQMTVKFPVNGSPVSSTNYVLDMFVAPNGGVWSNETAHTQATTQVQVDSLSFNTYPTNIWTPHTWTVKFNYYAWGPRKIHVDLLTPPTGYVWRCGNEITVPAGSGTASINVAVPNTFPSGYHIWSAYIAPTTGSYSNNTATIASPQIWVRRDPVQIISAPTQVQPGQTYGVTLSWDVAQNSDAHIDFVKDVLYTWYGGAWTNIGTGTGTRTFQVTVSPSTPLGPGYLWNSWVGPAGQGYTNATAQETLSPVTVLAP